jgi:hypothetical protein
MVFWIASFKACQSDSMSLFPMFRNVFPNDSRSSFIKRDVDRYKRLQQEVQYEVRQANKKYMEDVSTDYKENSKIFWSFIPI